MGIFNLAPSPLTAMSLGCHTLSWVQSESLWHSHTFLYIHVQLSGGGWGDGYYETSQKNSSSGNYRRSKEKKQSEKKSFWVKYEAWRGIERVRTWENKGGGGDIAVWEAHHSLLIKLKGMWCFCVKAAVGHFSFKGLNLTQSCTNFKSPRRLHCFQIELAFTKPALLFFCNLHLSNVKLSHQKRCCTPWR